MERNDQLKLLSMKYIPVELNSAKKFRCLNPILKAENNKPNINMAYFMCASSSGPRHTGFLSSGKRSPLVTHNEMVYPSLGHSHGVLETNKLTYTKIMDKLKSLEVESYYSRYRSIIDNKRKLNYFRAHSKRAVSHNCISIL